MRDGETKLHAQVRRGLRRSQRSHRMLHFAQCSKFAGAMLAGIQMRSNLLHLVPTDGAVKVGREGVLDASALRGNHHAVDSLFVPKTGEAAEEAAFVTSRARRAERPRVNRDLTVPRFVSRISAISSYENPSISRSTTTERNASGIFR